MTDNLDQFKFDSAPLSASRPPIVSVILPAYNVEKYVAEAIDSILAQTFSDFELIAVDDGSTDNTLAVLQSFNDSRLRVIQNKNNKGISETRNIAIAQARGSYLALQDADDISHPQRLAIQVDFLEHNQHIGVVSAKMKVFSGQPPSIYTLAIEKNRHALHYTPKEVRAKLVFSGGHISDPTTMFRASVIVDNKVYYNANFPIGVGRDIFQRLSLLTDITSLRSELVLYRKHDANISNSEGKSTAFGHEVTIKFWRDQFGVDISDVFDELGEVKSINTFHKLHRRTEQMIEIAKRGGHYDMRQLCQHSGRFLYLRLRKCHKQGEKLKTICRAYRNSKIISDLPVRLKRTLRWKCFFCRW